MAYWKIEAEDDTVYVEAPNERAAKERLKFIMGNIPDEMLTISEVGELPDGEDPL